MKSPDDVKFVGTRKGPGGETWLRVKRDCWVNSEYIVSIEDGPWGGCIITMTRGEVTSPHSAAFIAAMLGLLI